VVVLCVLMIANQTGGVESFVDGCGERIVDVDATERTLIQCATSIS
jgi:hypothetical protein